MVPLPHAKALFQTNLKRRNGENAIQTPYIKVTEGASPAAASGFILVSLSAVPRPVTILLWPKSSRSGRSTPDQR
jgi:hypothetical protein